MRFGRADLSAIDRWRAEQDDAPSRPEAVRRLVELGLLRRPLAGHAGLLRAAPPVTARPTSAGAGSSAGRPIFVEPVLGLIEQAPGRGSGSE